jgi:hypothetical protein
MDTEELAQRWRAWPLPDAVLQLQFADYRNAELAGPVSGATLDVPLQIVVGEEGAPTRWRIDTNVRDIARQEGVDYRSKYGGKQATWHSPDARMKLDSLPQRPGRDRTRNLVLDRKFRMTTVRFYVRKASVPYDARACVLQRDRDPYTVISEQIVEEAIKANRLGTWWNKMRRVARRGAALLVGATVGIVSLDPGFGVEQVMGLSSAWDKPLHMPAQPEDVERVCNTRPTSCDGESCSATDWFQVESDSSYCRRATRAGHSKDSEEECLVHEDVFLPFSAVVRDVATTRPPGTAGGAASQGVRAAPPAATAVLFGLLRVLPAGKVMTSPSGGPPVAAAEMVQLDINEAFVGTASTTTPAAVHACESSTNCVLFQTRS